MLDGIIQDQKDPEPFSGVVSVTRGEEVLFRRAYGLAHRSESIPNSEDTRFAMASGCKTFTAASLDILVEEGVVRFDAPLKDCVDEELPRYSPDITLHHLLTHTSGITSYFEEDVNPDYEAIWRDVPVSRMRGPRDFLPLFRDKPVKFPPGERFDYNDGGYILLGLAIECITGRTFPSFVQENLLEPAGMLESGYFPMDQLPERTARGYIRNADGAWRTNAYAVPIVGGPDGGAYTTTGDLALFWKAMLGKGILEERVATELDPPYTRYGYGVWIEKQDGRTRKIFMEGFDPGVAMRSAVYPDEEIILTVLGNTGRALWPLYPRIEAALGL